MLLPNVTFVGYTLDRLDEVTDQQNIIAGRNQGFGKVSPAYEEGFD
jgi:hypothetical protein